MSRDHAGDHAGDHVGDHVVAVDIGGTKTAVAAVDRAGSCGPVLTRPTPARDGAERVLQEVADAVQEVRTAVETGDGTRGTPPGRVVAVAVGAAGVIDERSGRVLSATDAIAGWPGTEIASGLQRLLDLPVFADNDVNAHAAGEAWLGAGRGARTVLVVAVGTGVGGAVVIDGQPLHGVHHVAGEVGHVPARGAEHLTCGCGRRGHLEAVASGTGLLQHYRSLGGRDEVADSRAVLERAAAGDEVASRAVEDAATALGTSLAGMVMLVDPDVVVVGGGLAEAGDLWWEPVERTLRAELVDVAADVPLRRAVLGGTAPLVGAARNAWHRLGPSTEDAR